MAYIPNVLQDAGVVAECKLPILLLPEVAHGAKALANSLFINLVHQNGGRLSSTKHNHFSRLSDERIARMENAVRMAFNIDN